MSARPYMPLWIADYLVDTMHLSTLEHGAYLLLLMQHWRAGSLPKDDRALAAIARCSGKQWKAIRATIAAFFDANWEHKRVKKELDNFSRKSEARVRYGAMGGRAKALKTQEADLAKATDLLEQNRSKQASKTVPSSTESESESEVDKTNTIVLGRDAGAPAAKPKRTRIRHAIEADTMPSEADAKAAIDRGLTGAALVVQWRKFRDHHLSRGSLMADWSAAWRTWLGNVNEFSPRTGSGNAAPPKRTVHDAINDLIAINDRGDLVIPPPVIGPFGCVGQIEMFPELRDGASEAPVRRLSQG